MSFLYCISLLWLAYINILACILCREDARRAEAGIARISQGELIVVALTGGWPVMLLARMRDLLCGLTRNRRAPLGDPIAPGFDLIPAVWLCAILIVAAQSNDRLGTEMMASADLPTETVSSRSRP